MSHYAGSTHFDRFEIDISHPIKKTGAYANCYGNYTQPSPQ
jgi:hypothetical protein